jgi:hypothetical protein
MSNIESGENGLDLVENISNPVLLKYVEEVLLDSAVITSLSEDDRNYAISTFCSAVTSGEGTGLNDEIKDTIYLPRLCPKLGDDVNVFLEASFLTYVNAESIESISHDRLLSLINDPELKNFVKNELIGSGILSALSFTNAEKLICFFTSTVTKIRFEKFLKPELDCVEFIEGIDLAESFEDPNLEIVPVVEFLKNSLIKFFKGDYITLEERKIKKSALQEFLIGYFTPLYLQCKLARSLEIEISEKLTEYAKVNSLDLSLLEVSAMITVVKLGLFKRGTEVNASKMQMAS